MTDKKDKIYFRATKENADYIKTQKNQQEYLNAIIEAIRNGELVDKTTAQTNKELDLDIKRARLKNLQLDAAIKQQKLTYMETFGGALPSHQATIAIRKYAEQKIVFDADKAEPKVTDSQWSAIIAAMTRQERGFYFCTVNACSHGCQRIETAKQHIADNHEELFQESLRVLK